jgi:alanyl-tRNA synthetase
VLGAEGEKPMVVVAVSDDLVKKGIKAGDLAKSIGAEMGGGGGGKPHLASAGGKDLTSLKSAMKKSIQIIKEALEG